MLGGSSIGSVFGGASIFGGSTQSSDCVFYGLTGTTASGSMFVELTRISSSGSVSPGFAGTTCKGSILGAATGTTSSGSAFGGLTNTTTSGSVFGGLTNTTTPGSMFVELTGVSSSGSVSPGFAGTNCTGSILDASSGTTTSGSVIGGLTNTKTSGSAIQEPSASVYKTPRKICDIFGIEFSASNMARHRNSCLGAQSGEVAIQEPSASVYKTLRSNDKNESSSTMAAGTTTTSSSVFGGNTPSLFGQTAQSSLSSGGLFGSSINKSTTLVSEEKGCKMTWSAFDLTSLPTSCIKLRATFDEDETKDAFIESFKDAKDLALENEDDGNQGGE